MHARAAGLNAKRQRVSFWQVALAALALVLLGLNVGAVFNSKFPPSEDGDEVSAIGSSTSSGKSTSSSSSYSTRGGGGGGGSERLSFFMSLACSFCLFSSSVVVIDGLVVYTAADLTECLRTPPHS